MSGRDAAAMVSGSRLRQRAADAAALLITILVAGWLLWTADKTFDVTDEGFYLLATRYPADTVMLSTSFHHLTAWLFWTTGGSIAAMRVVAVLGTIGVSVCLGRAALAVCGARPSALAVCSVVVGSLLAYTWLLLTPSYNTYNTWAITAATTCLLRAFLAAAREPFPSGAWRAWMCGVGLALGLSLFVKFPSAAAFASLAIAAVAAWPGLSRRQRRRGIASVAAGTAAAVVLIFLTVVSPATWWHQTVNGVRQATTLGAGHGVNAVARYAWELRAHLGDGTPLDWWVAWAGALLAAAVLARSSGSRLRSAARMLLWLAVLAAAARSSVELVAWLHPPSWPQFVIRDPFPLWIARFYLHWLALALAVAAGAALATWSSGTDTNRTDHRRRAVVTLLLFGGNAAAAFGTANPIYVNLMLSIGSWSALLVLATHFAGTRLGSDGIGRTVPLVVLVFAAVTIVAGSARHPYGQSTPLLQQTTAIAVGDPPARLRVDAQTHRWLTALHATAAACGFRPGDDLLAFHNMPGAVYALGGRSPGLTWFTTGLPGSQAANEMGLAAAGRDRAAGAFILQTPDATPWLRTLSRFGITFPDHYVRCGSITRDFYGQPLELTLWRPDAVPAR